MSTRMSTQNRTYNTTSLEEAIYRTVAFFDLFDYPLADSEIWKFLMVQEDALSPTLHDVRSVLASSVALGRLIGTGDGMYHRRGRDNMRTVRKERMLMSHHKYLRARRMARVMAVVPFVRMLCVCNTLGLNAAREESDIDFFIVASAGHLWFVRLACAGLAQIFGMRPRAGMIRDTACLSFYVSDNSLDLSALGETEWIPDLYLAYWTTFCVPLYDSGGVYERFFSENAWVRRILPNTIPYDTIPRRRVMLSLFSRFMKRAGECFIELFGKNIERVARAFQIRILPDAIRSRMNKGTGVVVSDSVLKFHIADRRSEIREKFERLCKEL